MLTAISLAPALPALAAFHEALQERRQQRIENIEGRREGAVENLQERREEARTRLTERRKEIIRAHFGRMMKRMEAALERLRKLGERIQSRIEKAKANGRDVTAAQSALDSAKAKWQDAKNVLNEAKGKVEGLLASDDPRAAFQEVRALVASVRDKMKEVHAALVDAITALKGIGGGERRGQTATSTP